MEGWVVPAPFLPSCSLYTSDMLCVDHIYKQKEFNLILDFSPFAFQSSVRQRCVFGMGLPQQRGTVQRPRWFSKEQRYRTDRLHEDLAEGTATVAGSTQHTVCIKCSLDLFKISLCFSYVQTTRVYHEASLLVNKRLKRHTWL